MCALLRTVQTCRYHYRMMPQGNNRSFLDILMFLFMHSACRPLSSPMADLGEGFGEGSANGNLSLFFFRYRLGLTLIRSSDKNYIEGDEEGLYNFPFGGQ